MGRTRNGNSRRRPARRRDDKFGMPNYIPDKNDEEVKKDEK